jgi:hypothetical protein
MSTATQTLQGFSEAKVQKLPSLACIGYVDEVGEGKVSSTGNYVVQPIKLRAHTPGRNANTNILYRPEWLDPNFEPNDLDELGEEGSDERKQGKSMLSVYRRNIAERGKISALKGLAGSEENFAQLANILVTLPRDLSTTDGSTAFVMAVSQNLRDFLTVRNEGVDIGYILRQRQDKAGEDENGKTIYELANGYEVQEYFFPSPEKLKSLRQRAAKTKDGAFKIAFDEDGQ